MFYLRRTNTIGNVFFVGLTGEWHIEWRAGIGGYKVKTYKTLAGAKRAADTIAKAYPSQTVSVMTDEGGTRVVATFGYPARSRT